MRNANGSGHEQRRQTDGPGKDEVNRMNDFRKTAQEMLEFIRISPTCFHAVANIGRMLEAAGFQQLQEKEEWKLEKGGRYYTERNDSSVIAFVIPEKEVGIRGFHMAAAHSDSPCFKIKEKPELTVEEHYLRLNTEKYGGMILSTWLDRPLSVAGRLAVKNGNGIEGRLVNIDRDLCVIPNVAIHMNREMNKGVEYNPQVDLLPLLADVTFDAHDAQTASENAEEQPETVEKPTLAALAAETAGVDAETILGEDLFLYTRQEGKMIGAKGEFVLSPRLDDLQSAFALTKAFTESTPAEYINLCAVFDNEEVGSGTRQGADSTFLEDTLQRITEGLHLSALGGRQLPDLCGQCPCGTSQPSGKSRPCQPPVSKRRNRHQISWQPEIHHRWYFRGKDEGLLRTGEGTLPDLCQPFRHCGRFHSRQYFHRTCISVQRGYRTASAGHAFRCGDSRYEGYGICGPGAEGILGRMILAAGILKKV